MIDWDKIREDFPITKNMVYFQSAGMSPLPTPVFDAIVEEYKKINQSGDIYWQKDMQKCQQLCQHVERLIHSDSGNVTFVSNTSLAMSLVALSLKQNTGTNFNIVSMIDEFPSSTLPFEYQKIEMRYVEPMQSRYLVDCILQKTDRNTLAVVTSHVQYCTGFRQNLEALGRELKKRKILHIVNATQSFPLFPIDVKEMNIDVLSASLHKWGCAGHVGSIFYTSPEFRQKFKSPIAGWLSVAPKGEEYIHIAKNAFFQIYETASQYNFGTMNLQPLMALQVSLNYLQNIGWENIQRRILKLTDHLIAGLHSLGVRIVSPVETEDERSAIVSFYAGSQPKNIVTALEEQKIYVACRKGNIRVSINIFNNEKEIESLLTALTQFVG